MENMDFNEMQEQINILKKKLANEDIVNDRLIRKSIKEKVDYLKRQERMGYFLAIFVVFCGSGYFYNLGLSWMFIGATILMMALVSLLNYWTHKDLRNTDYLNDDLFTTAKAIRRVKKINKKWITFGMIGVLLWAAWLMIELRKSAENLMMAKFFAYGVITGIIIGLVIAFIRYHKIKATCDDIISQIEK